MISVIESIKNRYAEACNALDSIMDYRPTEFNGTGWDGDTSNQFGRDSVLQKIYDELYNIEEDAEVYGIAL